MALTQTITGSISSISLTSSEFTDPVTVATGAIVGNPTATGSASIGINAGQAWTVDNSGTIYGMELFGSMFSVPEGASTYNNLINERSGVISYAGLYTAVQPGANPATAESAITNWGRIQTANIDDNGTISNEASGSIQTVGVFAENAVPFNLPSDQFALNNLGTINSLSIYDEVFSVINSGVISSIQLEGGGQLSNTASGSIGNGIAVIEAYTNHPEPITIDNGGVIAAPTTSAAISLKTPSQVVNQQSGDITGRDYGIYASPGGDFGHYQDNVEFRVVNAGTISGGIDALKLEGTQGDSLSNFVGIEPGAVFNGNVVANPSSQNMLALYGSGGVLNGLGSKYTGFQTLDMHGTTDWTVKGTMAGFDQSTIDANQATGVLDLTDLSFSPGETASFNQADQILSIRGQSGDTLETLALSAQAGTAAFSVQSDSEGGTDVLLCYLQGTRVLTPAGEKPVEALRIGDMVVTRYSGIQAIRWIGLQSYAGRFLHGKTHMAPVRIRAGALGEGLPTRDLLVSPGHSMLLAIESGEERLVLASTLINGVTITQDDVQVPDEINYYQFDLFRHDCLIAEGTWSETYGEGDHLRGQFHNVAEFYELFPDRREPEELILCAPRPERGLKLDQALRPVVMRAMRNVQPGPLVGCIDLMPTPWKVEGWAYDPAHPDLPVLLEVLAGEEVIGTVLACDHRIDLELAGYGRGRYAFFFLSEVKISPDKMHGLKVRRASDHVELIMSSECHRRIDADFLGIKPKVAAAG